MKPSSTVLAVIGPAAVVPSMRITRRLFVPWISATLSAM
jgi:hypothetical protein